MIYRRVVVTGIGLISPLGLNVLDSWQAILAGKSGVGLIDAFDVSDFSVKIGACIKNFDPLLYMDPKDVKKNDTFIQLALAAASQAITDAALEVPSDQAHRVGVIVGSGIGGLPKIEKTFLSYLDGGPRKISPNFIPSSIINMAPGL